MANPYQLAIFVLREISKIQSHIVPIRIFYFLLLIAVKIKFFKFLANQKSHAGKDGPLDLKKAQ